MAEGGSGSQLRLGLWLGFSLSSLLLWVLAARFLFQGH